MLYYVLLALLGLLLLASLGLLGLLYIFTPASVPSSPSEHLYISTADPSTQHAFPPPSDMPDIALTVVVPAFNERERLPAMLKEAVEFLQSRKGQGQWEVLVVDDCSRDGTREVALEVGAELVNGKKGGEVRVIRLERNRGKGGAVKHGMLHARGERVLFVDADGASRFADFELLERAMDRIEKEGHAVVVGSRAHLVGTEATVKRSWIRNLLMRAFHLLLLTLSISTIRDTQCGFKLFTHRSARLLFPAMHLSGWIFDVELLLLAEMASIPLGEVAIQWHEVDGSKVRVGRDGIRMALDLLVIRGNYLIGRWTVPSWKKES